MRIAKYPHPILSYRSKPLRKIDQGLRDIVAEMFELMYEFKGVGLAANQVELPYRLVVINPSGDPAIKEEERVLINPTILKRKGRQYGDEGCLSFPELYAPVERADEIEFQAIDLQGQLQTYRWKGFYARVVQHETDHLNGRCFVDQVSSAARLELKSALDEMRAFYEREFERGFEPTPEEFAASVARWEAERT